jgi:hypothetical protein
MTDSLERTKDAGSKYLASPHPFSQVNRGHMLPTDEHDDLDASARASTAAVSSALRPSRASRGVRRGGGVHPWLA